MVNQMDLNNRTSYFTIHQSYVALTRVVSRMRRITKCAFSKAHAARQHHAWSDMTSAMHPSFKNLKLIPKKSLSAFIRQLSSSPLHSGLYAVHFPIKWQPTLSSYKPYRFLIISRTTCLEKTPVRGVECAAPSTPMLHLLRTTELGTRFVRNVDLLLVTGL